MSKEWLAAEAAREILNPKSTKSTVVEIVGNYPIFSKEVISDGSESLVRILEAVPKLTASIVEKGLRGKTTAKGSSEKSENTSKAAKGRPKKKSEEEGSCEEDNPYIGKSAKELYEMCKERGIKVKTRQTADVYAEMLMKDDEEEGFEDADEQEEEKPVKSSSKGKLVVKNKSKGRPKKEPEPEPEDEDDFDDDFGDDDDDDDWEV